MHIFFLFSPLSCHFTTRRHKIFAASRKRSPFMLLISSNFLLPLLHSSFSFYFIIYSKKRFLKCGMKSLSILQCYHLNRVRLPRWKERSTFFRRPLLFRQRVTAAAAEYFPERKKLDQDISESPRAKMREIIRFDRRLQV